MRNMEKQSNEGRTIIRNYETLDLTADEANQVFEAYKGGCTLDALLDVIMMAYYAGVATGTRHGLREAARVAGGTK